VAAGGFWAWRAGALHDILPMSLDTLQALTWDMVCSAVPSSQIEFRRATASSSCGNRSAKPINTRRESKCWAQFAVAAIGVEAADPEGHDPLAARIRPTSLAAHRARLLTIVATLACLRVNVVARRTWPRVAGLAVHRSCAKQARPAARCEVCPPLFPLTRCAQGGVTVATDRPRSRQQASDWIHWAVTQAGGDSTRFWGISARKSGTIETRVDEAIFVPSKRSRSGASGPRIHTPYVAQSLPRDV
jgi:hypothetical protein